eukprot:EC689323.1.p2 GENE.EC689323.1~~EC689323.1.p2  ORF type:complete len:168 (+),score=48.48 EC689323.1:44-505(+)
MMCVSALSAVGRGFGRRLCGAPRAFSSRVDVSLTEEERELMEGVRRFGQAESAPIGGEVDRSNQFSTQLWAKMGELGVLGIGADPDFGGVGLGVMEQAVEMEEISRASGSVALSYGRHSILCVDRLSRIGSPDQKAEDVRKMISGEFVGALVV